MSNPKWEERLKQGPYEASPSWEQMSKIKQRTAEGGKRKVIKRWWIPAAITATIITAGIVVLPLPSQEQQQAASMLTNNDLNAIIPSKDADRRFILYKETIGTDKVLVFMNEFYTTKHDMNWRAGYVHRTDKGWEWEQGGEQSISLITAEQYADMQEGKRGLGLTSGYMKDEVQPLAYGMVVNPYVTQVKVTDEQGNEAAAQFIKEAYNGYSLWFAELPAEAHGSYLVEGIDRSGEVRESASVHTN
ncbi:hypothetical protein ACFO9Q_21655 [Paenibacillus sp. GCM10023252]|uniref:hypothetical protein n=1 Tax=Paenibacillus sp. GCM10023252 TaxID=3252649 RepID=UPI00360685E1